MDEVLRISKELEKTVSRNDAKRALDLLKMLEAVPMTLDVLQKTHIGKTVNEIRKKNFNPDVCSLSKMMVKKWKKLLSSSSSSSTSTSNSNSNNNNNTDSHSNKANGTNIGGDTINSAHANNASSQQQTPANQDASPQQNPVAALSSTSNQTKDYSKRPAPTQTEAPATTSEVRLKCRQLLTDALKKPLPKEIEQEPFLEEEMLAARIEEAVYQEFKNTDTKYKNRCRSRVSNLADPKNPYLRLRVLQGEIAPEKIAKMTADEMASPELKKVREIYTKQAINDHQMSMTTGTKTSEIKCPKCKKYNVTYNQVQTRSADEPMTTFCFCNECGKRWKFC